MGKVLEVRPEDKKDSSVWIDDTGCGYSFITFKMENTLIMNIMDQVKEATGDNLALNFRGFVNSALKEYLKSEDWFISKQEYIDINGMSLGSQDS